MTERMDRDSVLHKIYGRAIERAKSGSGQIRSVQVTTPGKEITLAHVIGSPEQEVYDNLALELSLIHI